ncbi:sensor histidine kinase [Streptomyces qinzhouensis]|uniref:histidine kinase n=1 Tax=Streptomyces qinzhouensis TaxID=2599401 RepID=A0A5B8ITK0_9ACTN|nr:sensor histidine kinase [Streptomyces qinzhouensis]
MRRGWDWLMEPDPWSRRSPWKESGYALLLAVVSVGAGLLMREASPVGLGFFGAGVVVLALLRRRFPATVFLVTSACAGPLAAGIFVLTPMAWSAGRRIESSGRTLAAFVGAYVLLSVSGLLLGGDTGLSTVLGMVLSALIYLALVIVPGLAGRYLAQRQTLLDTLRERNAQLLRESRMVAGQARLLERQRIAQDMHDSLGHQLALIAVHTGALEVDSELTDRQREAVGVLRQASVGAMHELREVVGILREGEQPEAAAVDESGRAVRGTAGVAALVAAARGAGRQVVLRHTGERRPLAAAADHAAYRIVQESLTNAYKHAPGASIAVELRYEPDSLVVEIVNGPAGPGRAGEVVSGGQGLTGLRERARLVGGIVHAGAADGGGFRVAGVLPYGTGEKAPFVVPEDDFPRQSADGSPSEGVPAMNWNVSGQEPVMGEMYGAGGGRRNTLGGVGLGCGIAMLVVVVIGAAVAVGGYFLVKSAGDNLVSKERYEEIAVGTAEEDVRKEMPSGGSFWTSGIRDAEGHPKKPENSECLVVVSEESASEFDREAVFRFCFRDGKLIEKASYEVTVDL